MFKTREIWQVSIYHYQHQRQYCEFFRNRKEVEDYIEEIQQSNNAKFLEAERFNIPADLQVSFYFSM